MEQVRKTNHILLILREAFMFRCTWKHCLSLTLRKRKWYQESSQLTFVDPVNIPYEVNRWPSGKTISLRLRGSRVQILPGALQLVFHPSPKYICASSPNRCRKKTKHVKLQTIPFNVPYLCLAWSLPPVLGVGLLSRWSDHTPGPSGNSTPRCECDRHRGICGREEWTVGSPAALNTVR